MKTLDVLDRMVTASTAEDFVIIVRLILTLAYTSTEAEPIVHAVKAAILANLSQANMMVKGSSQVDTMARTIAILAERGGCLRGSDQIELVVISGMRKVVA